MPATATITLTPAPTATATLTPTATATPKIPVLANTAVPNPSVAISVENVKRVIQLAMWGGNAGDTSAGVMQRQVAWSLDGTLAIMSEVGVYFYQYQPDSFELLNFVQSGSEPWSMAISPDGSLLALGDFQGSINILDGTSGSLLTTFAAHHNAVDNLAFSPDGCLLATASGYPVSLWDAENRELLVTLSGHTDSVTTVAFSPDGSLLASGAADGTIRLWGVWP